jgi:hypothetical protein
VPGYAFLQDAWVLRRRISGIDRPASAAPGVGVGSGMDGSWFVSASAWNTGTFSRNPVALVLRDSSRIPGPISSLLALSVSTWLDRPTHCGVCGESQYTDLSATSVDLDERPWRETPSGTLRVDHTRNSELACHHGRM